MAQIESTPISQDELSQILGGNVDSVLTPENKDKTPEKKEDSGAFKKVIDTDFSWAELAKEDETDETKQDEVVEGGEVKTPEGEKKTPGRKVSDLVSMINELVESKELEGYEDGPAKTIEEAKELIKLNIERSKNTSDEEVWQSKLKSYSPQIQAILHYAEQGGTDIGPLISAISEIERVTDFDIEKEEGQESIISEYLKSTGWSEEDIKDEIETAKDLGKLKTKAEKFLPKLNQMSQQRAEVLMQEQEVRKRQAEEARRGYLSTIKDTLDKERLGEMKLARPEKAQIWDGLTDIKYTSWSGQPTNLFFKKLEEMQAGDKADYDHFLEVVYHTLNRKSFKDKLREEVKTQEAANTVRKLKTEESKKSSTNEGFESDEPRRNAIKRTGFKNPWG
jgi:hypothetical protein